MLWPVEELYGAVLDMTFTFLLAAIVALIACGPSVPPSSTTTTSLVPAELEFPMPLSELLEKAQKAEPKHE